MSHRSNRRVAFTTLGCKVNQADTDRWVSELLDMGYEIVDFDRPADAYVVNTCTVTHVADRKSRQVLRRARRQSPSALVVATGCYASVATAELTRMAEIDLVIGGADKDLLAKRIHDALEGEGEQTAETSVGGIRPIGARTRAFIKISDGCNKFCTFCIVPYARGRERSVPADQVIESVRQACNEGYRETVVTAVHMGTYGRELRPKLSLGELVGRILAETEIERLRLSSIEPEDFDLSMLKMWSDRRLCRHFHLAIDSGCDATLKRMRRRYTYAQYRDLVGNIRSCLPDAAITTDVMVGFPGETEAEFEESFANIDDLAFAGSHVFPYSRRRGTAAWHFGNEVDPHTKSQRGKRMIALAEKNAKRFQRRFAGAEMPVLYEAAAGSIKEGNDRLLLWEGLTDNYLRVVTPAARPLVNQLEQTLLYFGEDGLSGALVEPAVASSGRRL